MLSAMSPRTGLAPLRLLPAILLTAALVLLAPLSAPCRAGEADEGLFARLRTGKGEILIRLFYKRVPLTVMNFVGLAEGTLEWRDQKAGKAVKRPLYRNLTFHRVSDYMIQTGDPLGNGKGNAGFEFADEFDPDLKFDAPGAVAMANRGPNTNSSQFFITKKATPWMHNRYTVFGKVVKGMDVVNAITVGDALEGIEILRKGQEAEKFGPKAAHEYAAARIERLKKAACKTLPKLAGPVDPAKVPGEKQPRVSPGSFDFLVIGHNDIPGVERLGRVFCYDHDEAMKVAGRIVEIARAKGADFREIVKRYTDMPYNTHAENVAHSPQEPTALEQIFHLKPGQISEPVDMPTGVYVFKRLK